MAAKLSHSDRSLKLKFEVLQNLDKETHQKDFSEKKSVSKNTKIWACYETGLDSKRTKPEMYENK